MLWTYLHVGLVQVWFREKKEKRERKRDREREGDI